MPLSYPGIQSIFAVRARLGSIWRDSRRTEVRTLRSNPDFTMSVFVAVAITCLFAFVLEATVEVVASMLVIGGATAIAEHVMRNRMNRP